MIHDPPSIPHVPAGVPVRAMEDILALRMRQIIDHGHTAERDRDKPIQALPIAAGQEIRGAIDYCQFHRNELARRYLVRAGALILAAIDRLDMEEDEGL